MSWKKNPTIFTVVIVAPTKAGRQKLEEYYFAKMEHRYATYARSVIYKLSGVSDVARRLERKGFAYKLAGRKPKAVFSQDFPEPAKEQLRQLFSSSCPQVEIEFLPVPVRSV